jgi:ABC-type antimicrobial peptide transport system permease subunit
MDDVVWSSLARRRFTLVLLAAFGVTGLLLAALGIGSVVSYTVAQRRRELGIRLALGARPTGVRNLVLGGSMGTVLLGIGAGLGASVVLTRFLRSLLYGVAPADPATLAAVAGLLGAVALAAAWLPARRAVRIDPIETLREG